MLRTRTRGSLADSEPYVQKYYTVGGIGPTITTLVSGGQTGSRESITDENHPTFRKDVRAGNLVLGELTISKWSREYTAGHILVGWHPVWGKAWQDGDLAIVLEALTPALPFANDGDRMGEIALVKAYAKAKAAPLCGGEILNDLGTTIGMLRRPFSGATDLIARMLRSRNRSAGRTGASFIRANAGAWLEYRYGWKPLLLDAKTIIEEARRKRDEWTRVRRSVARAGERVGGEKTTYVTDSLVPGGARLSGSVFTKTDIESSAGVFYSEREESTSQRIAHVAGARACDIPATIWEVIPYSFVLDWFVNVGDWLQAVTPVPYLTVENNWVTVKKATTVNAIGTSLSYAVTSSPPTTYFGSAGSSWKETFDLTRKINQPLPLTPLVKSAPLSLTQTVDAISLLTGRIHGQLRNFRH